jgi:PAS domain S-box-containing protein
MATQNIKEKRLSSNLLNRKIIKPCGGLAKTKHKRSKAEISEYKSVEQRLAKLNECLLSFGPNPDENINLLVALCGEQLGATCALYNRLKDGMLYSVGQWNTPPDFTSKDKPDGHICYDLIQSGQDEVRVIRNLPKTTYAQTDPNVMCYGLKTYVGIPVSFESALIGSLCVVYQEDYVPSEDDKKFLGIIASAIGVEEKRKEAEEVLQRQREELQIILNSVPASILYKDKENRFIRVNKTCAELLGRPKEEIEGKSCFEIFPPDQGEAFWRDDKEVMASGRSKRNIIEPVETPEGTKWVQTDKIPYRNEKGNIIGVIGFAIDITERKQAEEALRQSEERYRTLVEESFNGIFIQKGPKIIFANQHLYEMLRYDKGELEGMDHWLVYHPDYQELTRERARVRMQGENVPSQYEVKLQRKDGSSFDGEINARKIMFDSEPGIQVLVRDITERKQAEKKLRESEEKYRTILENIEEGYYEVDIAGNFTFFNDSLCRMLGYIKDELMGMNNRQYTDQENAKKLYQAFNKVYKTGEPEKGFDWKVIRKDGTIRFVEASVSLIKDYRGQPIGFRGIVRDITERKRTEEEMVSLQEQLRQSQKIEAVGQLAGGIAHDFNNLLTVIKGYSQLSLLDLKESDPLWENIQEIQKATQRATDLTRQLLAFSRRQILDLKVLNLNTLLQDLNKMLRRVLGEDIELTTLLAKDLGRVKIDPGQIEQVILNLAVNARDAMPSGGKLTIETANVELDEEYARAHIGVTPGRYVRLSVSDTGFGMSKEVKEKVFEPFFTTKEKGKGTGLGLSTVYGIVKQIGGNIWVYSELNQGTTFKIYLPRVEEEATFLRHRDDTEILPQGRETVLLVEDDPSVRGFAVQVLRRQGYTVLEATNGEEALRVVQEQAGMKIHLLLTDVVMPQKGGKELADRLKILQPDIKVLFISGYTDNAIVDHGVLEPNINFLQKPFSPTTLARKVREVLDR